jgi:hypothetical protein
MFTQQQNVKNKVFYVTAAAKLLTFYVAEPYCMVLNFNRFALEFGHVEISGFEPLTSALQRQRSTN